MYYHGQPIAVVVADTLEHAEHAATLVRATYEERSLSSISRRRRRAFPPQEG